MKTRSRKETTPQPNKAAEDLADERTLRNIVVFLFICFAMLPAAAVKSVNEALHLPPPHVGVVIALTVIAGLVGWLGIISPMTRYIQMDAPPPEDVTLSDASGLSEIERKSYSVKFKVMAHAFMAAATSMYTVEVLHIAKIIPSDVNVVAYTAILALLWYGEPRKEVRELSNLKHENSGMRFLRYVATFLTYLVLTAIFVPIAFYPLSFL